MKKLFNKLVNWIIEDCFVKIPVKTESNSEIVTDKKTIAKAERVLGGAT